MSASLAQPIRPLVQRTTLAEGSQGAAVTTAQHWPPDCTFFLHLLPLLTFPRQQRLLCTTLWRYGLIWATTQGATSPSWEIRRNVGHSLAGWQDHAWYCLPGCSLSTRLQSEPATSFLQPVRQALGSSGPLPAPQPATSQSAVLGHFVLSPQSQLDIGSQKGLPARQGPVGPYQLRVEGLACDRVSALVAEAFP